VSCCYFVCFAFGQQRSEPAVSQLASSSFKTQAALARKDWGVTNTQVQLQPKMIGQLRHKLLVRIGLGATDAMMEVSNRKNNAKLLPQFQQHAQESHGIRAAGNSNSNAVAGNKQPPIEDVSANPLNHCSAMLLLRRRPTQQT